MVDKEGLSLFTLVDLPEVGVSIDETWYPYAAHWRWSLIERARFGSLYGDLLEIERKDTPSTKDQERYRILQIELCKMAAPTCPVEKFEALPSDGLRVALITDFLTKSGTQGELLIPKALAAIMSFIRTTNLSGQIGDQSSRASRRATGVTKNGGATSRSRS